MGSGISIALATYNGETYIREQLDSYVKQTVLPDELVVSDDGSTDATLQIVADFAKTAPFSVRILPPGPRLGFADNFMRAAMNCQGEFIAFSDQDDVWLPQKLEKGLLPLKNGSWLTMHASWTSDANLKPLYIVNQNFKQSGTIEPRSLDPYMVGCGHTMMLRRELVDMLPPHLRPPNPEKAHLPLSHDHWFLALATSLFQTTNLPEGLVLYRQHSQNIYGAEKRSLRQKIADMTLIRLGRYNSRIKFYRDMHTTIYENLHKATPTDHTNMSAIKKFYDSLCLIYKLRIELYTNKYFLHRLIKFITILMAAKFGGISSIYRIDSLTKDFFLGLFGIGTVDAEK